MPTMNLIGVVDSKPFTIEIRIKPRLQQGHPAILKRRTPCGKAVRRPRQVQCTPRNVTQGQLGSSCSVVFDRWVLI